MVGAKMQGGRKGMAERVTLAAMAEAWVSGRVSGTGGHARVSGKGSGTGGTAPLAMVAQKRARMSGGGTEGLSKENLSKAIARRTTASQTLLDAQRRARSSEDGAEGLARENSTQALARKMAVSRMQSFLGAVPSGGVAMRNRMAASRIFSLDIQRWARISEDGTEGLSTEDLAWASAKRTTVSWNLSFLGAVPKTGMATGMASFGSTTAGIRDGMRAEENLAGASASANDDGGVGMAAKDVDADG
jgi:hypothetical protein